MKLMQINAALKQAVVGISMLWVALYIPVFAQIEPTKAVGRVPINIPSRILISGTVNPVDVLPTILPATIPLKRDALISESPSTIGTVFAFLGLIVFLGGLLLYVRQGIGLKRTQNALKNNLLARWLPEKLPSDLKIIASTRLTSFHSVHVLQWHGRQFLLGCGKTESVTLLSENTVSISPLSDIASSPTNGSPISEVQS